MKKRSLIIFLFLTISVNAGFRVMASEMDSLKNILTKLESQQVSYSNDSLKVSILNLMGWKLILTGDYDKARKFSEQALKLAETRKFNIGISQAYNNLGVICQYTGNYPEALQHHLSALKIRETNKDPNGNLDKKGVAASLGNIGIIYYYLEKYNESLNYHTKSLKLKEELGDKKAIAGTYNNIGIVYQKLNRHQEALINFQKAVLINEELNNKNWLANGYANLGNTYFLLGNNSESLKYHKKALELMEQLGDKTGAAHTYNHIGTVYLRLNQIKESRNYLQKGLDMARSLSSPEPLKNSYLSISELDSLTGNYREAYNHYKLHIKFRDSLTNEENSRKAFQTAFRYEYDKKATADSVKFAEAQKVKDAQLTAQNALIEEERTQRNALFGGLALVLIFSGFIYNRFRVTRKQKEIIHAQKEVVENQKNLVEEKNKEIMDSIQYAKRIQDATLPSPKMIDNFLSDYFILYKPKDIVAGDFYWVESIDDNIYFTAADCTGHGVPGAMVSVMCTNALTRTVKELGIREPAKILDKTVEILAERFDKGDEDLNDGMDLALCCLNYKTMQLQYAGANNPLCLIRKEQLVEIKADKQPVGKFTHRKPFTNHVINIEKGDIIYLFSDGFADQFGGERGKKYKYSRLKELLLSVSDETMNTQKHMLIKTFENWKGDLEQLDDVCIIGVRV